ncbi:BZ3500_MvSof-1268-A1-R1_Chr1-3g01646 [Microbotryum saponariae]|uniref:BZ3500_MvSof-1268-A1-R1_Chr1-3g01646 protein n=1 Tax=Microbotryum saponariae TaxID=289078 RepID=A0A2X0KGF9_9BASI|nr:BZ3500_MvSof-1268-A1-R1_Chr1-3g01646 [Microbotryum saponariae]SCZ94229.1 BZ3501_MvSof-1269-A2-R1_Chr1-3g01247 [Microbotryum saponariae]
MIVTSRVGSVRSALPLSPPTPSPRGDDDDDDDDDMAGLTTASLVGLYEPEPETELDHGVFADHRPSSSMPRSTASSSRLTAYLGLDRSVRPINAVALASSTLLSITLLVFLNASQPFLLDLLDVPNAGRMTGQLVLADELVALGCYSVWGFISDRIGVRWVAVAGHALCGVALVAYVNVPLSVLIIARMLFAVGASALVTALSAALSSMTALPESESESDIGTGQDGDVRTSSPHGHSQPTSSNQTGLSNEHSRLLATSSERATTSAANKSARFAGLLGFSSGLGALLAVFVLLPLPAQISARFANVSLRAALRYTYYLTAALAFVESLFLIVGLNRPSTVAPIKSRERQANSTLRDKSIATLKEMSLGVRIARQEPRIALGYLVSFTSRASATIVTGFIPLLINHYFVSNGLCSTPSSALDVPTPSNPPFEVCRRALILASILTGVVQLVSLLCSPLVGFLASSLSFTLLLALTSTLGTVAFIGWSFLPHHGDPRGPVPIVYAILAGISQIGGIVISLALVAQARGTLVQKQGKEVAGVIAAAYSVSGGLGILLVGTSAGWLFDAWKGAPFAIVAVVNGVTAVAALTVWRGENRGRANVRLE